MKSLHKYLSEFVYGGMDGCITTFAVVSGAIGASMDTSIILILGFANLIADGFAMSVGAYLSAESDKKMYKKYLQEEYRQVKHDPEEERSEIREIYRKKGFSGKLLDEVVDTICSNDQRWVEEMMMNEHALTEEKKSSFYIGFATFVSFCMIGFIPLSLYVLDFIYGIELSLFLWTSLLTGIGFITIGYIKTLVTKESVFKSIFSTLSLGSIAATLAYFVGFFLEQWIQ